MRAVRRALTFARVLLSRAWAATRRGAAAVGAALWRARAELLAALALLGGWALLTHGVAQLVAVFAPRATGAVWPLGTGVLLLSAVGWGFAGTIARRGLYVLTREPPDGGSRRA